MTIGECCPVLTIIYLSIESKSVYVLEHPKCYLKLNMASNSCMSTVGGFCFRGDA
jgi:hypothetical protein